MFRLIFSVMGLGVGIVLFIVLVKRSINVATIVIKEALDQYDYPQVR